MTEFILNSGKTYKLVINKQPDTISPNEGSAVATKPSPTSKTNEKEAQKVK